MDLEANKEYSVNWKNHMSYVRKAFDNLLSSNELTDITLYCEGRKIGAHKILLSACSAFFRETFMNIPCQHPVIVLYGIEYNVLLDILHFMYNGEVKVEPSRLESFLRVAQHLEINGLNGEKTNFNQDDEQTNNISETDENQMVTKKKTEEEQTSVDLFQTNTKSTKRSKSREDDPKKQKIQKQESDAFPASVKCEPAEIADYDNDDTTGQLDYYEDDTCELIDFEDSLQEPLHSSDPDLAHDSSELYLEEDVKDLDSLNISDPLSLKSRQLYELAFERYVKWCDETHNAENLTDETVLLEYFTHLSTVHKPSSLWSYYSMLRTVINSRKNIDISKCSQLTGFLKVMSKGYKPKKSKILTRDDVITFLKEADDSKYLMMKVALIVGLRGGCLRDELTYLSMENVIDEGKVFRFVVPNSRTRATREFFVTSGSIHGLDMVEILRKYIALRPNPIDNKRFFLSYRNGKCTRQPVGVNTLGAIPKIIASFLKLPNPKDYTSLCFRRSSNTLLPTL